jgi:hypothetical protein
MTNPTEPGAASVSVIQPDREAAADYISNHGLRYRTATDIRLARHDNGALVQAFAKYRLALTTPARSSGEMERMREALAPWRRVWAVAFAPFDNGPGKGVGSVSEDQGVGPQMPRAWPTIGDLRTIAALTPNANEAAVAGDGITSLKDVIGEARKSLALTMGCLECNADDERRWQDTIHWLESLQ